MRTWIAVLPMAALIGCQTPPPRTATLEEINQEMARAISDNRQRSQADAVSQALIPPLKIEMPPADARVLEPRFDLLVNNAPAREVFMGIVSGTRYSMLVHPEVSGTVSVNLKDVTVPEALHAIRELYGYEYKIDGNRIFIHPLSLQTRVFQVNYLTSQRKGSSEVFVSSGAITTPGTQRTTSPLGVGTGPQASSQSMQSSKLETTSRTDFWEELKTALRLIVGEGEGRSVVASPQSGVVVVRAMPGELRAVEQYLQTTQLAVGRQVILEAKIIEVELRDGSLQGINWAAFDSAGVHRASGGADTTAFPIPGAPPTSGSSVGSVLGLRDGLATAGATLLSGTAFASGLFGIAFQTSSFAALMAYLETQGTVHVLSSPRIATLNNQKAVLKVGTDELYVTNVSNTTTTGTATTTTPTVELQPFFSGIALDVTPQIDEANNIILHIHPSVSDVTTKNKEINLGSSGTLTLPLPSSSVSETDSIVRAQDGQVIAIGGLMRSAQRTANSGVPGIGEVPGIGALFSRDFRQVTKRELVILLKPTVVKGGESWNQDIIERQRSIQSIQEQTRPRQKALP